MRSKQEILDHFPDLKYAIEVDQVRMTKEYDLGYAMGSIAEGRPHYCFNPTHLCDVTGYLLIAHFHDLRERDIDPDDDENIRATIKSFQAITIGWFDSGREYQKDVTIDKVMERLRNERLQEQRSNDRETDEAGGAEDESKPTAADLSRPTRRSRKT